jgi:hypothetical protein
VGQEWESPSRFTVVLFSVASAAGAELGSNPNIWILGEFEMNWILGRIGLRALGAAVVVFAAALFAAATPSVAASYTLNFSGTVANATGVFSVLGVTGGDPISGSITYDPFNDANAITLGNSKTFAQSASSWNFHVNHPGTLDFTHIGTGDGEIGSASGPFPTLHYSVGNAAESINLLFETNGTGPVLASLAALPTNPAALFALLTGAPVFANGRYGLLGYGDINFTIAFSPAVAATPIPAALPLFGAGLAMFGFVGWKRRGTSHAAA